MKNAKKVNNPNSKNKKFKLGMNTMTFLIFIVGLALLFLIVYIPYSYISVYNANNVDPFVTGSVPTQVKDSTTQFEIITPEEFEDFNIEFYVEKDSNGKITKYAINNNGTKLEATLKFTKKEGSTNTSLNSETYVKRATMCYAADWAGVCNYASSNSALTSGIKFDKTYKFTMNYSGTNALQAKLPVKAPTWPIKVTVSQPNLYVYISYTYMEKGEEVNKAYVIEYTPEDYNQYVGVGF